jgi:hypothetical protein
MSRSRRWCLVLAAIVVAFTSEAQVAAQTPLGARRVVIAGHLPAALEARIQGQTADLDWTFETEPAGGAPDLGFEEALELAASRGARIVIWFHIGRRGLTVQVADAEQRRLFARALDAEPGTRPVADSALLETAAVMIRSTLLALSLGGEIGVTVPPPPPAPEPPPPPSEPPPSSVELLADVGYAMAFDGQSAPAQHGPSVDLGAGTGIFLARLGFTAGLRQDLDGEVADVTLGRHALRASFTFLPFRREAVRLELGASAGVALYRRSTESTAPGYTATASHRQVSGLVGIIGRLAFYPGPRHTVGIALAVGADTVLPAPLLQYKEAGMVVNRNDLWVLQPWTAVQLEFRAH